MNIRRTTLGLLTAAALALSGIGIVQSGAWAQGSTPRPSQPGSESKPSQPPRSATAARMPELIALQLHADWCSKCKAMKPAVTEMEKQIAARPVLVVTLDQTDKQSPQAEYLVAALGFADLWKEHAGKTGYILLIDPKTRRVVGRLTPDMDAGAMTDTVNSAIKS